MSKIDSWSIMSVHFDGFNQDTLFVNKLLYIQNQLFYDAIINKTHKRCMLKKKLFEIIHLQLKLEYNYINTKKGLFKIK